MEITLNYVLQSVESSNQNITTITNFVGASMPGFPII